MNSSRDEANMPLNLFLCGDVMLGRGVDQILPNPNDPRLREPSVRDARDYVALAVQQNGPIPTPVDFRYVWGDALVELERANPDFRIVNLETSLTASNSFWPSKDIHYRMHPKNVGCLTAAKIDCATLANNHSLDFGYPGLTDSLATLSAAGIKTAGAGQNHAQASEPAILTQDQKRLLIFAYGHSSSGVDATWSAVANRPGVNFLSDFSDVSLFSIKNNVAVWRQPGDAVILSIHWSGNWGYEIEKTHRDFAHRLINEAGVDVVYGHSSHHVRGIEIYQGKVILYGCGDFIDDYEGISGYEAFRDDLALMYFLHVNPPDGSLLSLEMIPMQIKHFRLQRASTADAQWLREVLNREGKELGTQFELRSNNCLHTTW